MWSIIETKYIQWANDFHSWSIHWHQDHAVTLVTKQKLKCKPILHKVFILPALFIAIY